MHEKQMNGELGRTGRRGRKPGPTKGQTKGGSMQKGLKQAAYDAGSATAGGMLGNFALKQIPSQGGYKDLVAPGLGVAGGIYGISQTKGALRMLLLGLTTVSAYRTVGVLAKETGLAGLGSSDGDSNLSVVKDMIPTASNQLNGIALGDLEEVESFDFEEEGDSMNPQLTGSSIGQLPAGVKQPEMASSLT